MKKLQPFTLLFLFISVVLFGITTYAADNVSETTINNNIVYINKDQVQQMIKNRKDLVIIDVLSPDYYAKGHIKGSINIPLTRLSDNSVLSTLDKNKTYIVYCASKRCHASVMAAEILLKNGFKNVYDYKNGIAEWKESGLPIELGK